MNAVVTTEPATGAEQFLTFVLGGEEYGVTILQVQGIQGWDRVTPIPNTPDFILGVINLRGAIVPIVDLRRRFGMPAAEFGPTTVVIVVRVAREGKRAHARPGGGCGVRGVQRERGGPQARAGLRQPASRRIS